MKVPNPVEVTFPTLKRVAKRLVDEAVVEKREVVVAEVAVALPVMFKLPKRVEEAVEMKLAMERSEVVALCPAAGCVQAS